MQPKSSDPPSTVPKKDETWVGDRRDRRDADERLETDPEPESVARVAESSSTDLATGSPVPAAAPAADDAVPAPDVPPPDVPPPASASSEAAEAEAPAAQPEEKATSAGEGAGANEDASSDPPSEAPSPAREITGGGTEDGEAAGRTSQTGEARDSVGPGRSSDEYTVPLVTPRRARELEEESPPPSASGTHEFEPGRVVDGRYQIEELLGTGAVGLVYRCRHLVLDKTFAIKVLRPDFARDAEVSARLVNEAKAASAIGSPHIIETVDFGRLSDGSAFFVMEYLDGVPLTALIDGKETVTAEDVLHIGIQMAEALTEAHAAGIVHRDLKPDNVFIVTRRDDRRFVKILDFGIAKLARAERKLTRAGQIYGTPHYMSPEQAGGRATDARTDVYAAGIILYEMVTGRVPFDAEEPMGILIQHLNDHPPDIAEVRAEHCPVVPGIEVVLDRCLAKDPAHRYQSMSELRDDLMGLADGHTLLSSPRPGASPPKPAIEKSPAPPHAPAHAPRASRGTQVLAGLGILVSAVLGYALYTKQSVVEIIRVREPASAPSAALAPVAAPIAQGPLGPVEDPRGRPVMIVVIPPDALIYRGKENLGTMPVTVHVPRGKKVRLEIRAHKFITRNLTVDGSRPKVVVGLVPKSKYRGAKVDVEEAEADKAAEEMVGSEATLPVAAPKEAAPAAVPAEAAAKEEAPVQAAASPVEPPAKPPETAPVTEAASAKTEAAP